MRPDASLGLTRQLEGGLDVFVGRYAATLLHSAYLLIGDHGQAEDMLQLTLLRTARQWEAARRAPDAYARQVLVNLSRDRQRGLSRRVRERPLEGHDAPALARDPADGVIGRDTLIEALKRLPLRQREVVVMRFFADLTIADTAAAIGTSEATVKSHTRRALARLRELLADDLGMITEPTNEVSGAD